MTEHGTEVAEGNTKTSATRARNYCWTSYDVENPPNFEKAKYWIYGNEICPTTSRPHLQGFVIFNNPRTLAGVIKEYKGIHFETCKGNIEQNIEYCSKAGDVVEHGSRPAGQGKREDIDSLYSLVRMGTSDREICETEYKDGRFYGDMMIKYYKGVRAVRRMLGEKKRSWQMDVRIYWGPPGSGKTRSVWEEFEDEVYAKMPGKWWDHYAGEQCVLIDDFDPEHCFDIGYDFYLKLLDRYPMLVEWKGGSGQFYSKTIIFTSNFKPDSWFKGRRNRDAFFRRVNTIKEFTLQDEGSPGPTPSGLVDSTSAFIEE